MAAVTSKTHLLDALPFVGAHLEDVADEHATKDAQPIANDHVEYPRVPPALGKVWQ